MMQRRQGEDILRCAERLLVDLVLWTVRARSNRLGSAGDLLGFYDNDNRSKAAPTRVHRMARKHGIGWKAYRDVADVPAILREMNEGAS